MLGKSKKSGRGSTATNLPPSPSPLPPPLFSYFQTFNFIVFNYKIFCIGTIQKNECL